MHPRLITFVSTLLLCAGLAHAKDEDEDLLEPKDFSGTAVAAPKEDKNAKIERQVDVAGIVGTMTEFDVRTPLEERSNDFDRCHDQYGSGGGRILFHIHVKSNGSVGDVKAHPSKVKKDLVDCYTDVVASTHFPTPHGGYADVKWTTKVGRAKKKRDSDLYDRNPKLRWDAPAAGGSSKPAIESKDTKEAEDSPRERRHRQHRSHKHRKRA